MVLDERYQKKILSLINKTMKTDEISSPELDHQIWGYENEYEFKHGHRAGFLFGLIIGDYMSTYNKFPPKDDLFEIKKILESHIDDIKSSVLDQYFFYKS